MLMKKKKMVVCPSVPIHRRISKRKNSEGLKNFLKTFKLIPHPFLFSFFFYNPKRDSIFNKGKRKFLMTRTIMQTS